MRPLARFAKKLITRYLSLDQSLNWGVTISESISLAFIEEKYSLLAKFIRNLVVFGCEPSSVLTLSVIFLPQNSYKLRLSLMPNRLPISNR